MSCSECVKYEQRWHAAFRENVAGAKREDALVIEIRKLTAQRDNLICRIHRDGGHYISDHGIEKAFNDADIKVAKAYARIDELEHSCNDTGALLDKCQEDNKLLNAVLDEWQAGKRTLADYWDEQNSRNRGESDEPRI